MASCSGGSSCTTRSAPPASATRATQIRATTGAYDSPDVGPTSATLSARVTRSTRAQTATRIRQPARRRRAAGIGTTRAAPPASATRATLARLTSGADDAAIAACTERASLPGASR